MPDTPLKDALDAGVPCIGYTDHETGLRVKRLPTQKEVDDESSLLPTSEQIITGKIQLFEDGLDDLIDNVAKAKGFGKTSMTPTASCLGYAGYTNSQQENAIAFGVWMDKVYLDALQIQADFFYGLIPEPTFEEVVAQLDQMVWPQ